MVRPLAFPEIDATKIVVLNRGDMLNVDGLNNNGSRLAFVGLRQHYTQGATQCSASHGTVLPAHALTNGGTSSTTDGTRNDLRGIGSHGRIRGKHSKQGQA
jgi:hypothetical protein